MDFERELTLNDYLNIVKRKFPYVVAIFFLAFMAIIAIALWIPPVYKATGTILIESQQVNSDLTKEKFETERFAALNQIVLSKDNLIKIAEKYKLYGLDKKPDLNRHMLEVAIRENIFIDRLKAEAEGWEQASTFAFNVSFEHYDAGETYKITNDLVKLFLDENERASKKSAVETAVFFSNEEAKRRAELEKIEKKLASYKRLYADSLPENKEMYVASLERLSDDLRDTQLEYSTTQAELRSLDVSLESAKAGIALAPPPVGVVAPTDLDALKLELAKQKSIYNDNHPAVRVLQRRIDALEKNAASATGKAEPVKSMTAQSALVAKVQAQIDTANSRIESLRNDEASIRANIKRAENSIMRSTQTEGALSAMMREYENVKTAYAEIKAKLDQSKIAKKIEMENKGERLVLIEAPVFPKKTIKPNRILIIVAGFFGALIFAVASAVLMETLDKRIRGADMLASVMKIQPMATIPYITNKAESRQKKYIIASTLLGILVMALSLSYIVHFFVMPLDILMAKIIARF